jgi:hypothetical protein
MTQAGMNQQDLVEVPEDIEEFLAFAQEQKWGDGLPLIPPTDERVSRMLDANPELDPDELIGLLQPRKGHATVRSIAVNAVMAGCLPEYLPVIVTAFRCMMKPEWNLQAIQTTTHPAGPLVVVHGPIARELGMNWGHGCFGPGNRANAAIGRAVRLTLLNVGAARPGFGDQSTQGQPSKYTFCIAENAEDSPWAPLHVQRGLDEGQSAVTVFGATNPENVNDHVSTGPVGVLHTMASVIASVGTNNSYFTMCEFGCIFGPEHAETIASRGWTIEDVQHDLYERARLTLRDLKGGGMYGMHAWPKWMDAVTDDDVRLPLARDPANFVCFVAGSSGKHSSVVKGYASNRSVTLSIG